MHPPALLLVFCVVATLSGVALFATGVHARPGWLSGLFLFVIAGALSVAIHTLVRTLRRRINEEPDDTMRPPNR